MNAGCTSLSHTVMRAIQEALDLSLKILRGGLGFTFPHVFSFAKLEL